MTPEQQQAVEKVREALTWLTIAPTSPAVEALAALDFLVSELAKAQTIQRDWAAEAGKLSTRAEVAEARVRELEA